MRSLNFLGLGFEVGQELSGLANSHLHLRNYYPILEKFGLRLLEKGIISPQRQTCTKIYSNLETEKIDWLPYKVAYAEIKALLKKQNTLVNWGGDHSVALSTVGGFCANYPDGYVLWIDAHADLNLPRHSPTGNLHGMPLSILMNLQDIKAKNFSWIQNSLSPQKLIYLGVRDLDPFEKQMIDQLQIKTFTSEDIQLRGIRSIAREISGRVQDHPLHVSFDIDSVSPEFASATGVPVPNGLHIEDLEVLGRALSKHKKISSVDVVEINPDLGEQSDVFQTYMTAISFLTSLLSHEPEGGIYDGVS